jgi:hypothetical protein
MARETPLIALTPGQGPVEQDRTRKCFLGGSVERGERFATERGRPGVSHGLTIPQGARIR